MQKFLWDIEIEEIPCGWADVLEQSINYYPNGTNVQYKFQSAYEDNSEVHSYWCHPVEFRKRIIDYFNIIKDHAKEYYYPEIFFSQEETIELVRYDIILYNLLFLWSYKEWDYSCFDPEDVKKERFDYDFYFEKEDPKDCFKSTYDEHKVLNYIKNAR